MDEGRRFGRADLLWGLYWGFILNLALAAILNNTFWEPTTATWLVTLGIFNELYGVLLVASPELEPYARRFPRWLASQIRRVSRWVWRRVGRLLGLLGPIVVTASAASEIGLASHARATITKNPPPGASDRDVIWWLVVQHRKAQQRLNDIEGKLEQLPNEWREDIAAARTELEDVSRRLVQEEADRRIELRLIGVGFIVLGILLTWVGSIV